MGGAWGQVVVMGRCLTEPFVDVCLLAFAAGEEAERRRAVCAGSQRLQQGARPFGVIAGFGDSLWLL